MILPHQSIHYLINIYFFGFEKIIQNFLNFDKIFLSEYHLFMEIRIYPKNYFNNFHSNFTKIL